ncbi:MAG: FHA domain-containing protein [Gemmatimonadaceae bacterium]
MERMMEQQPMEESYLVNEIERRAYPLTDASFNIGRDASCGIVIREPAVSRSHAEVKQENGEFVLHSTGSTGSRLNGAPVTVPAKLTDGDRIEIGSVSISFRQGRLPLGVSVVDTASPAGYDPDAINRRSTITNPILGGASQTSVEKGTPVGMIVLLLVLVSTAAWYFLGR